MSIFVAYYIAETNTINIFTNKTKTIMKYKLLRFSLLSVLVMLCGGLSLAAILEATGNEEQETLTLNTAAGYAELTVTTAGTSGTGSAMEFSKGDIVVTSDKGYIKDHEMTIYKSGTMTVGFKEGISAYITKVELTVKNYHFAKPAGWTAEYSNDVTSKIDSDETETFTTDATDKTSFTISNASSGKTTVKVIKVTYVKEGTADTRVATSITLVNPTTTAAVGDVVALPSAELKAADESNITDAVITWESSDETVAAFVDNAETGMKELKALKAGTATITASYAGNTTYKASSASFTLTVKEYTQYTTIASMLENITSTETDIKYTFSGLVCTYVNGSYTYVHSSNDGDILLFGANLGLEPEISYSGTLIGKLYSYNGLPEIKVASAADINAVQQGMVMVDIAVITLDQLSMMILPTHPAMVTTMTCITALETVRVSNSWPSSIIVKISNAKVI